MTTVAFSRGTRAALAATASLTAFSTAAVGAGLGRGLVTTYLPVLLDDIRDAPGLIGTVMLVNTAAGFFVPLGVGIWSDRLHVRGKSRTGPFIVGGSLLTAGGLAAIALGYASTYLLLALAAVVAYTGLNAVTTAHRALIPETFGEGGRAVATGAEEFALLSGTLVGVVAGGFLLDLGTWTPFAFGAAALPLLAVPTYLRMRGRERRSHPADVLKPPLRYYLRAATAPGARLVLAAQLLWVAGYIGLAPFFVLYADRELGLRPSAAASLLGAFGVVTALAVLGAGSVPPGLQSRTVVLGVLLLGGGLLGVSATNTLQFVAPGLLAAAVGFGLVTTLGFPLYARFIPAGEEGAYTALFFSVRSIASAIAVPAAGWTIAAAGSYRALFVAGGGVALVAVLPLAGLMSYNQPLHRPALRRAVAFVGGLGALCGSLLGLAFVISNTRLAQFDAELFDALHRLGGTPRIVDTLLVHPHIENYVALVLVAALAAILWRPEELLRVLVLVPVAGIASFALVRLLWAAWERPRPEEVLGIDPANGHLWAQYASFPSGHVVVTTALVTAIASRIPWLGAPLGVYAAVIAVTRVSYGAHFPTDVVAGVLIGVATARVVAALLTETQLLRLPRPFPPHPVDDHMASRLRWLGVALGGGAIGGFLALALTVGVPRSPDGGIVPGPTEQSLQLALLALAALAVAASLRYPIVAGGVLLASATATGMLAALEYNPFFAAGACVALFVPGVLLALGSPKGRTPRGVAAITVAALTLLVTGAFGAFGVHAAAFGPTHPESPLQPLPVTLVRWAWSGGASDNGFRVVAKLAQEGEARLLVSRSHDLRDPVATSVRWASHDANDRVVSFEASGLSPGRRYYYGIAARGAVDRARIGTIRTLARGPFSFTVAFGGCARAGSNGAVFDAIRERNPLFFLILGDFFYANIDANDREEFADQYDRALTRPAQSALYRSAPIDYVWDDHDYGPDDSDSSSPSRAAAFATYRALVPHYPLPDRSAIYHSFVVGRVRFVVTDTRSARTAETMLGARQKAWLKGELLRAKWNGQLAVWVNSVPWIAVDGTDSWAGYPRERRELADFVSRSRIDNLLMLAGDAHMIAIDDGTNNRYATRSGRFPVMHAAALDRRGDRKGGPYSEGAFPGSGQFGTMSVRDTGRATLLVTLAGWNYRGERIVEYSFTRTLRSVSER
jgi:membrane-associated phospholipid phosphatase/MFS family permease